MATKKPNSNGKNETKRLQLQLAVLLSSGEIRERHEELTKILDEMDKVDADLQLAKAAAKAAKEPMAHRLSELRVQLRTGKEQRLVDCEQTFMFAQNLAETIRLDTGEIVDSRPIQPGERQTMMRVEPPPAPAVPEVEE